MSISPNDIFNVDIEKELIAALFIREGEIIPDVAAILQPNDFYRPEHRIIYSSILDVYQKNGNCDFHSVLDNLSNQRLLKTNDNPKGLMELEYIFGIFEIISTNAYAINHANIIKEKAELRRLNSIADVIKQKTIEGLTPPLDIVADINNRLVSFSDNGAEKFSPVGKYLVKDFFKFVDQHKTFTDRRTGFSNIDAVQHLEPGLYILGATPACGKTTFAWQLLEQMAYTGEHCIFCSYEMSRNDLVAKTISRKLFTEYGGTLTAAEIKRGAYNPNFDKIIDEMLNLDNFVVRKFSDENVDKLLAILRPIVRNSDTPPVVCIDYLQRLIPRDARADIRFCIDDALFKLKDFSVETNATFLVVSTFNRTNYNQLVDFESFKESGGIEYTADVIWALQLAVADKLSGEKIDTIRKKINAAKIQQPRQINLKCLKNRHGNNYDCYFNYFSAHDYFQPCDESDFVIGGDDSQQQKNNSPAAQEYDND